MTRAIFRQLSAALKRLYKWDTFVFNSKNNLMTYPMRTSKQPKEQLFASSWIKVVLKLDEF